MQRRILFSTIDRSIATLLKYRVDDDGCGRFSFDPSSYVFVLKTAFEYVLLSLTAVLQLNRVNTLRSATWQMAEYGKKLS